MIILDTSVWIAFFKKQPAVFQQARTLIEDGEVLAIECVFGELLQGARNRREGDTILAFWNHLAKFDEQGIWIEAGKYSGENRLLSKGVGLIDAVLIVSALRMKAKIWTFDRKLLAVLGSEIVF